MADEYFSAGEDDDIQVFNIYDKIKKAVDWLSRLNEEGLTWNLTPPTVRELYPNMKNNNNTEWRNVKKRIADINNEITSLYYISNDKRNILLDKGINNFLDKNFLKELSNIYNPKTTVYNTICSIVDAQSKKLSSYHLEQVVKRDQRNSNEPLKYVYIDIETVYNHLKFVNDDFTPLKNDFIVQIGIGYINERNEWIYRSFDMNKLSEEDEERIISNFKSYIYTLFDVYKEVCLVHFTSAEDKIFKKLILNLF
jgi:hypothetical protein